MIAYIDDILIIAESKTHCNGTMVHLYVHWYTGTMVQWYTGTVAHWYTGTVVQ